MRASATTLVTVFLIGCFTASTAHAACTGTNGRGWGKGKGAGKFEMTMNDKICKISFPGFIDDLKKTRVPATSVTFTSKPKNGKISIVAGKGLIYTPKAGFKGKDRFCTRNTTPKVRGKTLSGCVTVTVR
ncbi:MAG: hypothetical protein WA980_11605 [Shinella zoogloeoides]|uniref:hypothetical protein n=1 Tax=Shinella zoogloeoides TaxID=352475 RepID=UPI003C75187D